MPPNISFTDLLDQCVVPSRLVKSSQPGNLTTDWGVVACPDPTTHNSLQVKAEQAELLYRFISSKYDAREAELQNGLAIIFDWVVRRLETDRLARVLGGGECINSASSKSCSYLPFHGQIMRVCSSTTLVRVGSDTCVALSRVLPDGKPHDLELLWSAHRETIHLKGGSVSIAHVS